ncbi:MAG TPA: hypothetical protein VGI13_01975 [Candidatus Acidoferrum sp.]
MTDDTRDKRVLSDEQDEQLSTADLAGRNQPKPRSSDLLEANPPLRPERELPDVPRIPASAANDSRRTVVGSSAGTGAAAAPALEQETGPLFHSNEANDLRARWDAIQVGFVDEPRRAVEQADNLVAGTMKRLAEVFAEERGKLEGQWDQGENVSTEDLRLALRRYRSFFSRLLSV